ISSGGSGGTGTLNGNGGYGGGGGAAGAAGGAGGYSGGGAGGASSNCGGGGGGGSYNAGSSQSNQADQGTGNGVVVLTYVQMVPVTQTYNYTGGLQSFTVPANVSSVTVKAVGARGGNAYNNSGAGAGAL
ncbi:hypothetical protein JGU66_36465, partial [Myxococcaceae bacterium JPH2]|nr:hypothetical protein [Myxococcaceae bacterium JPH2]